MAIKKFIDSKGNYYAHLYIDGESGIFYVVARKGSTVHKISLKTTNYNEARGKILESLASISIGKSKKKTNKLIREYFEDLVALKKADEIKPKTLRRIEAIWEKSIEPFWGHLGPNEVTKQKVGEFMAWHREKRADMMFVNVFKYLGNIFRVMKDQGALVQIPDLSLPKPERKHHAKKKGRVVTPEEFEKLIQWCSPRMRLIASLSYFTGMRLMEIGSLRVDQISREEGGVFINLSTEDTKTGLARAVPVPKELLPLLTEFVSNGTEYVFPKANRKGHIPSQIIDRDWAKAKQSAKIEGRLRFHDLRHTAATNMTRAGLNPMVAVTLLGMSLSTFQKVYLNLSKNDLNILSTGFFEGLRKRDE